MQDERKLGEMIRDIQVAMLTTFDDQGSLRSRPMATLQTEFDGSLWFFTHSSSPKVSEVEHDHRVSVSYADPDDHRYVSVSGKCHAVDDRERARRIWSPILKAWFPKGVDDPELALLRVDVEHAEYWDKNQQKMVLFEEMTHPGLATRREESAERKIDKSG